MMNVREILAKHKVIDSAIESKLEQIASLRGIATHITREITAPAACGGSAGDRIGSTVSRIADLEAEINRDIDELVEVREQIRFICGRLSDATLRTVLERRYILHEDWEDIADKMGYSSRHITRLHTRALDELERLFAEPVAS